MTARPAETWSVPPRPKLRREVLLHKRVEGKAKYFDLKLPNSQSVCSLYDFELELAKKMDGTRDLDALVHEAKSLGFALDRDMMQKFVRGLACYKLIELAEKATGLNEEKLQAMDRELDELRATLKSPAVPQPKEVGVFESMDLKPSAPQSGFVVLTPKGEEEEADQPTIVEKMAARVQPHSPRAGRWMRKHQTLVSVAVAVAVLIPVIWGIRYAALGSARQPQAPLGEIHSLSPAHPGKVVEVLVPGNARVNAGQVLAIIEEDGWERSPAVVDVQQKLSQMKQRFERKSVEQAQAVLSLQGLIADRRAMVTAAERTLTKAKNARAKKSAATSLKKTREQWVSLQEKLTSLKKSQATELAPIEAAMNEQRQAMDRARSEVGLKEVRAPAAGVLLTDAPNVGQRADPEEALFLLSAQ
jgi:biotin carboxyl carrier protein